MNKKVLITLTVLFVAGFIFCIYTKWDWALQMLLAGFVMVVIIAVKSRKGHDNSFQTNLAELVTIFGITVSPGLMDGVISHLEEFRAWVNTYSGFEWIQIGAYRNIAYILLVATMYFFAYFASKLFQDHTIMKIYQGKVLPPFDSDDFKMRRNNFCSMLSDDIRSLDIESQWNDYYFAPLEAEVIVEEFDRPKKNQVICVKALRDRSRENVVLILGDPGSGKSTVLRKLSKDLLKEVHKTNKIPLYINLKEWNVEEIFNAENPPRVHHLIDFIKLNLKNRLSDIWASDFISDYFDKLYEQGYFYFIFDSFDEIPMLLDETETSWLVNKISALLYSICSHNKNTKIVLSSRYFRQPTKQFKTHVKMQIKPFTETSIKMCFHNFTNNDQLAVKFFSEHREMMSIAKNPFYASLISLYYKDTKSLPTKEVDLYESFIISRLNQCERVFGNISSNGLNVSQVISYAQRIAVAIYKNANYGIEIPYNSIIDDIGIPELVIDILQKAKLLRVGGGTKRATSFSHRRFNEYFVACSLMSMDINSYMASIPTDSKWRDTLVLYAQICPESKANELIEFCCSFFPKIKTVEDIRENDDKSQKPTSLKLPAVFSRIFSDIESFIFRLLVKFLPDDEKRSKKMRVVMNTDFRQASHSLRFLISAFSSQADMIAPYRDTVFTFTKILLHDRSLLNQKLAIQTVPLLCNNHIETILDKVLGENIVWINSAAIHSCSYLNNMSPTLMIKVMWHYLNINIFYIIKHCSVHIFHLSLSSDLKKIRTLYVVRLMNFVIAAVCIPILFITMCWTNYNDFLAFISAPTIQDTKNNPFFCWIALLFLWILQFVIKRMLNSYSTRPSPMFELGMKIYSNPLIMVFLGIISQNIYIFMVCLLLLSKTDFLYFAYNIRYNFISFFKNIKKRYRSLLAISVLSLSFTGLILAPFIILSMYSKNFMAYFTVIITVCSFVLGLIIYARNFTKDYYKFQKLEFFGNFERQYISKTLSNFSTVFFQKKFLLYLNEKNINVSGEWKDSTFPRLKSLDLDATLAQLEEKWTELK